ncbi:MAG: hypothetical protein IK016_11225 [Lachnospiraceae bacterium]|nr:hypothetical protein [Lachnospiraceae bacterium]
MMQVKIEMDKKKIAHDDEYEPESIYECVRQHFYPYNNLREVPQKQTNVIVFEDSGTEDDFGCLWAANMELLDEDWFARYVKSWKWHDDEDGEEDILSQALRRRDGAFAYA